MNNKLAVLAGTMMSVVSLPSDAIAQTPVPPGCVTQNMAVPPNANTSDKAAPFFIDTTGLDFKTTPPTRDPTSANYPSAAELPDGTLPPLGAEGNFITIRVAGAKPGGGATAARRGSRIASPGS